MKNVWTGIGGAVLAVWCAAGAVVSAQSATRGLSAPELNLHLSVLPDGSVDVRETIVFDFRDRGFHEVDREISLRTFDGVIDVHASMDGKPFPEGRDEGQVRIRRGRTMRVTWQFPETTDSQHTFTLEYRAMGALSLANKRANLEWFVLPSRHRYRIGTARVEWEVPASAIRMAPPAVDGADGNAAWNLEATEQGWRATRTDVDVDETAVLRESFQMDSLAVAMPTWQVNQDRAEQMAPAFVIGAATLMVMTIGIVAMTLFRYHRPGVDPNTIVPASVDSLPPALGTAVTSASLAIGGSQLQATVLDLVRRKVLEIREDAPGTNKKTRYQMVMRQTPGLRRHEQVIADALWLHMKNGAIGMKEARTRLMQALAEFRRAVIAELIEEGLVEPDRRSAVKAMGISGAVVSVLGVAGLVMFRVVFGELGDLPLLLPGAVLLSGAMFMVSGSAISVLSDRGVTVGAQWRARKAWLKQALRKGWNAAAGEDWWPAGAGFGLASRMLKVSRSAAGGPPVPEWLSQLDDPSAALSMIVVMSAVQVTTAGGGGGAVGGGGSSGAH